MNVDGRWINTYGSIVDLQQSGELVTGLYRSHTGATGTYFVVGCARSTEDDCVGLPVSFCVPWASLNGSQPEPSWAWCSTFSGQVLERSGARRLVVHHGLAAATESLGLCPAGLYVDKLTFSPIGKAQMDFPHSRFGNGIRHESRERWCDDEGRTLELTYAERCDASFEEVQGRLESDTATIDVFGVRVRPFDDPTRGLGALAVSGFDRQTGRAISLLAMSQLGQSHMQVYGVLARSTSVAEAYTQNAVVCSTFRRDHQS